MYSGALGIILAVLALSLVLAHVLGGDASSLTPGVNSSESERAADAPAAVATASNPVAVEPTSASSRAAPTVAPIAARDKLLDDRRTGDLATISQGLQTYRDQYGVYPSTGGVVTK